MEKTSSPNAKRLVVLFWVLLAAVYFYLSYDFIRVSMNDREFGEYLQFITSTSGAENRPAKDIRTLIQIKADELGLPINNEQITINGTGEKLNVSVDYQVNIEIPIFEQGLYTKHFSHQYRYRSGN